MGSTVVSEGCGDEPSSIEYAYELTLCFLGEVLGLGDDFIDGPFELDELPSGDSASGMRFMNFWICFQATELMPRCLRAATRGDCASGCRVLHSASPASTASSWSRTTFIHPPSGFTHSERPNRPSTRQVKIARSRSGWLQVSVFPSLSAFPAAPAPLGVEAGGKGRARPLSLPCRSGRARGRQSLLNAVGLAAPAARSWLRA